MFCILYYDINVKRTEKIRKICARYLEWVQNSVFEGDITQAKLAQLKMELKDKIKDNDSIIIYEFKSLKYYNREIIGIDKKKGNII